MTITPLGLYIDNGQVITTHSMLSSYGRCPKQAQYKYVERLKKRAKTERDKPLSRGTWLHRLWEVHYVGGDWRAAHAQLSKQYSGLFDEEKEALGDLPTECERIMRSYLWHYGADKFDPMHGWKVVDTEMTLECEWPDGNGIYRCRLDMIVEDEFGLAIVDHKSHKNLPDFRHRLMDHASVRYLWCANQNGYPVTRFIWNYVRTKAPTVPQLVDQNKKTGPRLSTRAIDTDYPTYLRAIRSYGLDHTDYLPMLRSLHAQRWAPGVPQSSAFFRRNELDKDDDMMARVVAASMRTRDRMHDPSEWTELDTVERVPDRSCGWMCDYPELCETELFTGHDNGLRRKLYRIGDPLDYYQDQKPTE